MGQGLWDRPLVTTRIFPGAENPLELALELSEKLRFSDPCPLSLSYGFRGAYPKGLAPSASRLNMGGAFGAEDEPGGNEATIKSLACGGSIFEGDLCGDDV